jgi:hypothetical protein
VAERKHITRGLRFTLTAVYTLVFTLLLVGVSLLFWQRLKSSLDDQAREDLDQNWAVVKAYLRIVNDKGQDNYHTSWNYVRDDPDESSTVAGVQGVILIADAQDHKLEASANYEALGLDKPEQIRAALQSPQPVWGKKYDPDGVPYLTRADPCTRNRRHGAAHQRIEPESPNSPAGVRRRA